MKPKTAYQRRVFELSEKLPAISEKQKQWAFENVFEKIAYYNKGEAWCLLCSNTFPVAISSLMVDEVEEYVVCPHCGKKVRLQKRRNVKFEEKWYYTILTTSNGFQVCRHFIVSKYLRKETNYIYHDIHEVVQNWIDNKGKETIIARPCKPIMYCYDNWDFNKPMEIRQKNGYSRYDIDARYIYPQRKVLPIIKRNGFGGKFHGLPANNLFRMLLADREAEMLIKNGQYKILFHKFLYGFREFCMPYQQAIRIAIRNKYIVRDYTLWRDYLGLLNYFNLDLHNAHYVCPDNLRQEHDKLLERKKRVEERKARERRFAEAAKWEEDYKADKGKYFGICFGNENIVIAVIRSVAEMAEEGKEMKHCVFESEYFKDPDSLILSARDKKGKRLETIEVSTKTFSVVQSRGRYNDVTKYHDEIIELVNKNIHVIKAAS